MSAAHAYPANDWIGHELAPDCPCGPDKESVFTDMGRSWLFTHHALDGRTLVGRGRSWA